jgi:hypothetical protein
MRIPAYQMESTQSPPRQSAPLPAPLPARLEAPRRQADADGPRAPRRDINVGVPSNRSRLLAPLRRVGDAFRSAGLWIQGNLALRMDRFR